MGDYGVDAICEALKINDSLEILNLRGNAITSEGAEAIAESLTYNKSLTRLILKCLMLILYYFFHLTHSLPPKLNLIGERGAKALAQSLLHNRTLSALDVQCLPHIINANNGQSYS